MKLLIIFLIVALSYTTGYPQKSAETKGISETTSGLTYKDIIGKELIFEYDRFTVEVVITSDSTLYWGDIKAGHSDNEKTKTIHIDEARSLISWIEYDGTYVVVYADFHKGESSAFLYRKSGETVPVTGTISLND